MRGEPNGTKAASSSRAGLLIATGTAEALMSYRAADDRIDRRDQVVAEV
jgi:hypothetical protein